LPLLITSREVQNDSFHCTRNGSTRV